MNTREIIEQKPENWILLAGAGKETGSYVELGLQPQDTHSYLMTTLNKGGFSMLSLPQFKELLKVLRSGDAKDFRGNSVAEAVLRAELENITSSRQKFRAEFLNFYCKRQNDGTGNFYGANRVSNGDALTYEFIDASMPLGESQGARFDLDSWLDSRNIYPNPLKKGDFIYGGPSARGVGAFGGGSKVGLSLGADCRRFTANVRRAVSVESLS
jgi:hypothetical protein